MIGVKDIMEKHFTAAADAAAAAAAAAADGTKHYMHPPLRGDA